jgi:hypothetical protein
MLYQYIYGYTQEKTGNYMMYHVSLIRRENVYCIKSVLTIHSSCMLIWCMNSWCSLICSLWSVCGMSQYVGTRLSTAQRSLSYKKEIMKLHLINFFIVCCFYIALMRKSITFRCECSNFKEVEEKEVMHYYEILNKLYQKKNL